MHNFEHASPHTLDEVFALLAPGAALIAGGTDLVARMQEGLARPERVIDLKRVAGLDAIDLTTNGLALGALARIADIAGQAEIGARWPALAQACQAAASPPLRNMGTLGGNLLQASRCAYYRGPFECLLKGGPRCFARDGENREHALFGYADDGCVHVAPSDPAVALAALDARVTLRAAGGERACRVADLYHVPTAADPRSHTVAPSDVLVAVHVPATAARSVYLKAMDRAAWTFALASVAIALEIEGDVVARPRVVLGGVAALPWRAEAAEAALAGQRLDDATIARAAQAATEGARPLAHNHYKVPLVQGLVRQALRALAAG
jgi:xanthine dehydrogenase YagS FAD-binding subunit